MHFVTLFTTYLLAFANSMDKWKADGYWKYFLGKYFFLNTSNYKLIIKLGMLQHNNNKC